MPRLLDLFAGRFGWSKAFAARGWECYCIDLVTPPDIPKNCEYIAADVMDCGWERGAFRVWARGCPVAGQMWLRGFDFICASSPCEQFSVHGMKHFHPNPPYPELGIKLFNHTRSICEASGLPYVMENVRATQQFVGQAVNHCGPFYLWGSGVPAILPQGIVKGLVLGGGGAVLKMLANGATRADIRQYRRKHDEHWNNSNSEARKKSTALFATIPPELSTCVADYAERLLEQKSGLLCR